MVDMENTTKNLIALEINTLTGNVGTTPGFDIYETDDDGNADLSAFVETVAELPAGFDRTDEPCGADYSGVFTAR